MRTELLQLETILNTPLPLPVDVDLRSNPRKFRSACIRSLLKKLGITGVSVTTPNYSMAQSIQIKLPRISNHARIVDWEHHHQTCDFCQQHREAEERIERIILAAFPDLDDRSDTQTDYFDYCLSIS